MNNYKLTLSYDGTRYNGWQRLNSTEDTIHCCEENMILQRLPAWAGFPAPAEGLTLWDEQYQPFRKDTQE